MKFSYLLLTIGSGLGLWVVGGLLLVGHFVEAICVLVLVVASGIGGAAFASRAPKSTGLAFVGFCMAISLEAAAHMAFGMPPDLLWAWLNFGLLIAGGPIYLDFATRFPLRRPELRWLVILAYAVAAAVVVTGTLGWLGPGFDPMDPLAHEGRHRHFNSEGQMYGTSAGRVMMAMQLVALWVLMSTRRRASRQNDHVVARQALILMVGIVLGWLPSWVYIVGFIPLELAYWFHAPPAVFMAIMPTAGAFALLRPYFHDEYGFLRRWVLIGVGTVSTAYLLYLVLVRPLFVMLDQIQPGLGREPAVFGAAVIVTLLLRPLLGWMTALVDRVFYPHLVGFRRLLQEVSQALTTTIIPREVARLATENLPVRLGASGARLLVLDDLEENLTSLSDTPVSLSSAHAVWKLAHKADGPTMLRGDTQCEEVGLPAPALMLPLRVGGKLVGIYVLGARQPVVEYSRDELEQLTVLEHHLAIAVENGRVLRKIDALSQRALAEVEERNLIAREIHDTIAQGLTAASLQLDVAEATLDNNLAKASKALQRAQSIVRTNLTEARRSVLELRAPLLGTESLPAALSGLLKSAAEDIGATGSFHVEGAYRGLPARIETQLYRVVQEALHNAVKYSSASHLEVRLKVEERQVCLSIIDDGAGFDSTQPVMGSARGGFGIAGMGERMRLVGGHVRIQSEPGEGTLVEVVVPVETP